MFEYSLVLLLLLTLLLLLLLWFGCSCIYEVMKLFTAELMTLCTPYTIHIPINWTTCSFWHAQ